MKTVPISEIVPLIQWIQIYHAFRVRLDLRMYQTGLTLRELHRTQFGPEVASGVWETELYKVFVEERTLSFEVSETLSLDEAVEAFEGYQTRLFD